MADTGSAPGKLGLLDWAVETREIVGSVVDEIGRAVLVLLPLAFVPTLAAVLLAYYFLRINGRQISADPTDFARLVLGVVGIFGGLIVFIAFALTWPPAIEHLDELTLRTVGVLGGVPMVMYAVSDVVPRLFPKTAPMPEGVSSPSSAGTNMVEPQL